MNYRIEVTKHYSGVDHKDVSVFRFEEKKKFKVNIGSQERQQWVEVSKKEFFEHTYMHEVKLLMKLREAIVFTGGVKLYENKQVIRQYEL